jgi:hypothetical protein
MTTLQLIAAALGIAGALILAVNTWWSGWAWPVWVLSTLAWAAYAWQTDQMGLLAQNGVFLLVNLVGCYRWLLQPAADALIERVDDLIGG